MEGKWMGGTKRYIFKIKNIIKKLKLFFFFIGQLSFPKIVRPID
jgi:hypothetical protein